MKSKTKRRVKKILTAVGSLGAIIALAAFFRDPIISALTTLINNVLTLDPKTETAGKLVYPILFAGFVVAILLYILMDLNLSRPGKHYFERIRFGNPTDDTIRKAALGILHSEKSQPWFVHVAPVSEEIEKVTRGLYEDRFVWESGKPGDGKTMLAYHAIFQYRGRIGFSWRRSLQIPWSKCRGYRLMIDRIKDVGEIARIREELDALRGGRRKIVLVDDAHRVPFENELKIAFEEETRENKNGKVIWINTHYLEIESEEDQDAVAIAFDNFYPRLIRDFYHSKHPVVKKVISAECKDLGEAMRLRDSGKIRDPWHFNFIASAGEQRIVQLLGKIGRHKQRDLLLPAIFLYSVRNIITGDKAISQVEFTGLLTGLGPPDLQKRMETYTPCRVITDLASQECGRMLIIEHQSELNNGFLRAPHYRMSIAIVKSITEQIPDAYSLTIILASVQRLLTRNYADIIYFGIFFNAVRKCQEEVLRENAAWVKGFLTELVVEKLHTYPYLLDVLKRFHSSFYKELVTYAYVSSIAAQASRAPASKFKAIQELARVLGARRSTFIQKLDIERLAHSANVCKVKEFPQVADVIITLDTYKEKQVFLSRLNLPKLAAVANSAAETQLSHVSGLIHALRYTAERESFITLLDPIPLARSVTFRDVSVFIPVADLICALGDHRKGKNFVEGLDLDRIARIANGTPASQLSRVATLLSSLHGYPEGEVLIQKLSVEKLAEAISKAELIHFKQVENFIIALGGGRKKQDLLDKVNCDLLAATANTTRVAGLDQVAGLLNAFGNHPRKLDLLDQLHWETIAGTCFRPGETRISMLMNFIHAIGAHKEKLSAFFTLDDILKYSDVISPREIASFCSLVSILGEEKQRTVIGRVDWLNMLRRQTIHHRIQIRTYSHILSYLLQKNEDARQDAGLEEAAAEISAHERALIQYSTQYFVAPEDFHPTAKFLDVLSRFNSGLAVRIVNRLQHVIPKTFTILPRYYIGFANLLEVCNRIRPVIAYHWVLDDTIIRHLTDSFGNEDVGEQQYGLSRLLQMIKEINLKQYQRLSELNAIKMLNLEELSASAPGSMIGACTSSVSDISVT